MPRSARASEPCDLQPDTIRTPTRQLRRRTTAIGTILFILVLGYLCYARLNPFPIASSQLPLSATMAKPHKPKPEKGRPLIYEPVTIHQGLPASKNPFALLSATKPPSGRLIVIGDVHGQLSALEDLLARVSFSADRGDHVVFVGDMINKGPDSVGVLDLAISIGASAVRGNHEDKVLRAWAELQHERTESGEKKYDGKEMRHADGTEKVDMTLDSSSEEDEDNDSGSTSDSSTDEHPQTKFKSKKKDKKKKSKKHKSKNPKPELLTPEQRTARTLTPTHISYISSLPITLSIGPLGPPYGHLAIVHGGLVPDVPPAAQDPFAAMNMRTLLYPDPDLHAAIRSALPPPPPHFQKPSDADPSPESLFASGALLIDLNFRRLGLKNPVPYRLGIPSKDPSSENQGLPWAAVHSYVQATRPTHERVTVVYGHDAREGFKPYEYAFGLDSGCLKGKGLTAVVFEALKEAWVGGVESGKWNVWDSGRVKHRFVGVPSEAYDEEATHGDKAKSKSGKKEGKKNK
ncbi:Metallo-dependent phosphatase-like protein [Xylariaceae sp. FL0016]|nr:Metallo-dependent phosphatase-like protein [Xylariaceae sp. FL0016]